MGGVVLVISLAYLAYQLRQNTQSLRSENYARVLERMSTVQAQLSMDPELHHMFMVGAEDPARLARADRIRFSWALYELFGAGEFMFHQAAGRGAAARGVGALGGRHRLVALASGDACMVERQACAAGPRLRGIRQRDHPG